MTMEKRNLIEDQRTPDFAKQASEDELEKGAVDLFKDEAAKDDDAENEGD